MRYLVATDGSRPSIEAARFFRRHTPLTAEDEVFVIYVFPLPADADCYEGMLDLPTQGDDQRVAAVAAPILAATVEVLSGTDCAVRDVALVGHPAQEIVELATHLDIDVIVVGTRGRSLAREIYLGSVSNAVVHRAPCSVLIVR
jgi:nucleotide-binding universal stress UspA family protein